MDFSKLQVQKVVNGKRKYPLTPEECFITTEVVTKKQIIIQNATLAFYKKIYQYCDECKTETVFDIIMESPVCKICKHTYKLINKKSETKIIQPDNSFLFMY